MDLKEILRKHKMWLNNEEGGKCANLRYTDLRYANLRYTDLRYANLSGVDLSGANLSGANLRYTDLSGANLIDADLSGANLRYTDLRYANLSGANLRYTDLRYTDLRYANLSGANLIGANLSGANLIGANLSGANLSGANLRYANLSDANLIGTKTDEILYDVWTAFYPMQCPEEGSYIGWKKANGKIVKLRITADAKRSSATSRKCRASKAEVLDIQSVDGTEHFESVESDNDNTFIYEVGKTVTVDDFSEDRWVECASGIHHFVTRDEAVRYHN